MIALTHLCVAKQRIRLGLRESSLLRRLPVGGAQCLLAFKACTEAYKAVHFLRQESDVV